MPVPEDAARTLSVLIKHIETHRFQPAKMELCESLGIYPAKLRTQLDLLKQAGLISEDGRSERKITIECAQFKPEFDDVNQYRRVDES